MDFDSSAAKSHQARTTSPSPSPSPSPSRIGIVVDRAGDLPGEFFLNSDVAVVPVAIKVGKKVYVDQRNQNSTSLYLHEQGGGKDITAESAPPTVTEMQDLFLERFALDYDSVYYLTTASTRSQSYDNATKASALILDAVCRARQAAGIQRPLQFRIIDSKNASAAQGIPTLALHELIDTVTSPKDIRDRLYQVIDATYGYFVHDDLKYMRARTRLRGDRSIGLASAYLGDALHIKPIVRSRLGTTMPVGKFRGREESWRKLLLFTSSHVQRGLVTPHVVVSYGGALDDLYDNIGYQKLLNTCANDGVTLHTCQMSISGMANVGTHALCVGFAAAEHSPNC